ncbi:unnamed protein product [Ectocarpus sp. CCAP 1310/34]|nr:unnamed protein product [Ectocarpus sp. CCAP 1310/34]
MLVAAGVQGGVGRAAAVLAAVGEGREAGIVGGQPPPAPVSRSGRTLTRTPVVDV